MSEAVENRGGTEKLAGAADYADKAHWGVGAQSCYAHFPVIRVKKCHFSVCY